jgi:hypothetical protein
VGAFFLYHTIQSVATNEKVVSEHANSALDLGCYPQASRQFFLSVSRLSILSIESSFKSIESSFKDFKMRANASVSRILVSSPE